MAKTYRICSEDFYLSLTKNFTMPEKWRTPKLRVKIRDYILWNQVIVRLNGQVIYQKIDYSGNFDASWDVAWALNQPPTSNKFELMTTIPYNHVLAEITYEPETPYQVGIEIWNQTKGTHEDVNAKGTQDADRELSADVGDKVLIKQPHDTRINAGDKVDLYYGEYGQPAQGYLDTMYANPDGYWEWIRFLGGVPQSEAGTSKRYFVFINAEKYSDGVRLKVSGVGEAKGQITSITYPTTPQPAGAVVEIRGSTKNVGTGTGNFYMRLWDQNTGAKVMEPPRADNIPPGGSFSWSFKPVMPNKNWNLRVTVER